MLPRVYQNNYEAMGLHAFAKGNSGTASKGLCVGGDRLMEFVKDVDDDILDILILILYNHCTFFILNSSFPFLRV